MNNLTPMRVVEELDKYIIGQTKAKRAVAIALRNRYRRQLLTEEMREEVSPKNILMIGPTGVGKTEIARRLARLVSAPFIKVEATKFTEVGYVGRDVESMVRELVEAAIRLVRQEQTERLGRRPEEMATERILEILVPGPNVRTQRNPLEALFGGSSPSYQNEVSDSQQRDIQGQRERLRTDLVNGDLDERIIEIELSEQQSPMIGAFAGPGMEDMGQSIQDMLGSILPKQRKKRKVTVAQAKKLLAQEEGARLLDMDEVISQAVTRAEQNGIIFIDEIDKITARGSQAGPDVSREGVQRDILPIVEGCTVSTKYGAVKTDHMLFIAAGAFHLAKPSDLIPELQGRFPIRVELESLEKEDFVRILTEPQSALLPQYQALLATEGLTLRVTPDAIDEMAEMAVQVNQQTENIGARRLHTIVEKVLDELSFHAPNMSGVEFVVDRSYVQNALRDIVSSQDLSRYIL
ncbi:MAG: ATP-dependent protease ATPase subunit HslU [Bacillota bacterium]